MRVEELYFRSPCLHENVLKKNFIFYISLVVKKNRSAFLSATQHTFKYPTNMRTALFGAITKPVVVISYRRFRTTYRFHLQGSRILEPIGCAETSIRNYLYSLRNNPEDSSSHLLRDGSLKSRTPTTCCRVPAGRFFLLLHITERHLQ